MLLTVAGEDIQQGNEIKTAVKVSLHIYFSINLLHRLSFFIFSKKKLVGKIGTYIPTFYSDYENTKILYYSKLIFHSEEDAIPSFSVSVYLLGNISKFIQHRTEMITFWLILVSHDQI